MSTLHTKYGDVKTNCQNSDVRIEAYTANNKKEVYYGIIEEMTWALPFG
jgi:hypothetical protein